MSSSATTAFATNRRRSWWKRNIWRSPYFWTLLLAIPVTIFLISWFQAPRIVEIFIQSDSEDGAKVTCKSAVARSYSGPAFFEFCAELLDSSDDGKNVILKVRPNAEEKWYPQGSWRAQRGNVRGDVRLGSKESPITHDEDYWFQLVVVNEDRPPLATGRIIARANELGMQPAWLVIISLLAAVVQILQMLVLAAWPPPNLGESGAGPAARQN